MPDKFILNLKNLYLLTRHFYSKVSKSKPIRLISEKAQAQHFVDFKKLRTIGGSGGDGGSSFLRIFGKEYAGPDGGDGGNGGHVVFQADIGVRTLNKLSSLYKGNPGGRGLSKHSSGKNAISTFVKVPVGTFFRDSNGKIVGDLSNNGDFFIASRGGRGGRGNYFYLSNDNRAPTTYEVGGRGEDRILYAEMRVVAHSALIGIPNAGKSSLLRRLTNAKPKIGNYPFTTLFPHLGVIQYEDYEQLTVADIPGLIEGASDNRGLGFSFLRHVEQCLSLIFVIDMSLGCPWQQLFLLQKELESYDINFSKKPFFIVANKMDLEMSLKNYVDFIAELSKKFNLVPLNNKEKEELKIDDFEMFKFSLHNDHYNNSNDVLIIPSSAKIKKNIFPIIIQTRRIYDSRVRG